MKKHLLLLSTILLLIAYAALGVFAFAQEDAAAPEEELSLDGTWRVVSYFNNDTVTLVPCEYMVFSDSQAVDYRDSLETPFVETGYTIENGKLVLSALNRSYVIDLKPAGVLQLYTSPTEYMELVQYGSLENVNAEFSKDDLQGLWNIGYRRGLDQIGTEALEFVGGSTLNDYRNGGSDPVLTADYEWDADGHLVISRLAKVYILLPITHNDIYFVETDTGYVWSLTRAE